MTNSCGKVPEKPAQIPAQIQPYVDAVKDKDGDPAVSKEEYLAAVAFMRHIDICHSGQTSPEDFSKLYGRYKENAYAFMGINKDTFEDLLTELTANAPESFKQNYPHGFEFTRLPGNTYGLIALQADGSAKLSQTYPFGEIASWFGILCEDHNARSWSLANIRYDASRENFQLAAAGSPTGAPQSFPASTFFDHFGPEHMTENAILPKPFREAAVGTRLPLHFTATSVPQTGAAQDGVRLISKDRENDVNVIIFWGTWCQPCIHERQSIISKLAKEFAGQPVNFIFLANESESQYGLHKAYAYKKYPVEGSIEFRATDGMASPIQEFLRQPGWPSLIVVGADQTILSIDKSEEGLRNAIREGLTAL